MLLSLSNVLEKAVVCRVIAILGEQKADTETVLLTTQWLNDWWICVWRAWAAVQINVLVVVDASGLAL